MNIVTETAILYRMSRMNQTVPRLWLEIVGEVGKDDWSQEA